VHDASKPAMLATHMAAGCLAAQATDGSCGRGALSAGISAAATPYITAQGWNAVAEGAALSIIGGAASVAGGGKFASGARIALAGYLYNCRTTGGCGSSPEETAAPTGHGLEAPYTTVEEYVSFAKGAALTVGVSVLAPEAAIATGIAPRAWSLLSQAELKQIYSVEALKELFKNGTVSSELTREGLKAYRELASRMLEHYKSTGNGLGIATQSQRIQQINEVLKAGVKR
jgi:hypothetical protein